MAPLDWGVRLSVCVRDDISTTGSLFLDTTLFGMLWLKENQK
jgi:hypothetical protein